MVDLRQRTGDMHRSQERHYRSKAGLWTGGHRRPGFSPAWGAALAVVTLIEPKLLNWAVAIYLIVAGVVGLMAGF